MKDKPPMKVYFNSACPVCKAGIDSQKGKSSDCSVEWIDVHLDNDKAQDVADDLEFVRERLHVVDESGNTQVGFEAFIAIWRNSPREHWKAWLSSLPVLRPLLNFIYNVFARVLYRWNRRNNHW